MEPEGKVWLLRDPVIVNWIFSCPVIVDWLFSCPVIVNWPCFFVIFRCPMQMGKLAVRMMMAMSLALKVTKMIQLSTNLKLSFSFEWNNTQLILILQCQYIGSLYIYSVFGPVNSVMLLLMYSLCWLLALCHLLCIAKLVFLLSDIVFFCENWEIMVLIFLLNGAYAVLQACCQQLATRRCTFMGIDVDSFCFLGSSLYSTYWVIYDLMCFRSGDKADVEAESGKYLSFYLIMQAKCISQDSFIQESKNTLI